MLSLSEAKICLELVILDISFLIEEFLTYLYYSLEQHLPLPNR